MAITVGIFDLFTYSVPGSLYLALLTYLATRLGMVDPAALNGVNGLLLVGGAVLLSYLLGYIAYPLGSLLERVVPNPRPRNPRAEFVRRTPAARDRAFVQADSHLLVAGLELHDLAVATEANRLRASGLMLRNSAAPLLVAAVLAVVEAFAGGHPVLAATSAVLFAAVSVLLVSQARKLSRWATIKTLELTFWLPDVDEKFRGSAQP